LISDIRYDDTGPDEDPGSDSPLVFEAMKVFKTVQDFGNQLDNPRKIRMAHTVHFDAEDENHTEDEQLAIPPDFAKNTRDVQWRDPSDRLARYLTMLGIHISTSGDGADTCVVGNGWKILETTDPQRYANLVGYDENSTRKRHLKITTADSLATTDNDERIILRVHEAVSNPGSKATLLSDFQMREMELSLTPSPKLTKRTPMALLEHSRLQSMSIQLYRSSFGGI
jgi:hypothetical protein